MTDDHRLQERITACWNGAAPHFDDRPGHGLGSEAERIAWLEVLRRVLPAPPVDVLDLGTGTGFLALRAHELGHRVTGIDLAEEMLVVARREAERLTEPPRFVSGDAAAPAYEPGSFDVVMSRHLLWTVLDAGNALRNWRLLLRPLGILLIIDGIWPEPDGGDDEEQPGADFYTPELLARLPATQVRSTDALRRMVEAAGFVDVAFIDLAPVDNAEGQLEETTGRYGLTARRGG